MNLSQDRASRWILLAAAWLAGCILTPALWTGTAYAQSCQEDGGTSECRGFTRYGWTWSAQASDVGVACLASISGRFSSRDQATQALTAVYQCANPGAGIVLSASDPEQDQYGYGGVLTYVYQSFNVTATKNGNTATYIRTASVGGSNPQSCSPLSSVSGSSAACVQPITNNDHKCCSNNSANAGPPPSDGHPIERDSGNKWLEEVDYQPPQGVLTFVRSYNSRGTYVPRTGDFPINPMGNAWVHNFDRRLYTYTGTAYTMAAVVRANGTTRFFRLQADGSWLARTDDPDRLSGSSSTGVDVHQQGRRDREL